MRGNVTAQAQGQTPRPGREPAASAGRSRAAALHSAVTGRLRRLGPAALPVGVAAVDGLAVNSPDAGPGLWLALAAAAALVLRHRLPEVALAVGLPGLYLGHLAFAPLIALYCLAAERRGAVGGAVGAALVALAQFLPYPPGDVVLLRLDQETLLALLDSCALGAGAFVLGRSTRQRRDRLREVAESREREHRLLTERTLATERARLAREMHDVVAHKVSLISLQAGTLQVTDPDGPGLRETAGLIRELSVTTLTELQYLVGVLRAGDGTGGELATQPRVTDLHALVDGSALRVGLHVGDVPAGLPEAVERAVYRTVQEALTNIRKHAPGADADVRVWSDAGTLHVEVRNAAADRGATPLGLPDGGHGLIGLRERAQLLGGTFGAGPLPDGGFLVRAGFPVRPRDATGHVPAAATSGGDPCRSAARRRS
ncbi:two-component sensor histidine kinase [Streptomyces xinghaiensis]|uniref:histidine kinase n=1 Tax=Streptomyces xinghaiensis TaxID=1038928 RepID=A0A3M8FFZ7_9ACTN|nr:two-component sensor histidine kinase [Streptomyces xinghaiensis]RKM98864.1 two-component sensor histidine kinase [Streptomyces xinghaiensis]RNC76234.1 two-component sensor histidine kinase [Streptomyces xinghaiensis]